MRNLFWFYRVTARNMSRMEWALLFSILVMVGADFALGRFVDMALSILLALVLPAWFCWTRLVMDRVSLVLAFIRALKRLYLADPVLDGASAGSLSTLEKIEELALVGIDRGER